MLILQQLKLHKRKEINNLLDYVLKNIDSQVWKEFKAVAALQGKTVRVKILEFVEADSKKLTALIICKDRTTTPLKKGG